MQAAQVYEIMKDLSRKPEKIDLLWENSQFENFKNEEPERQNHIARNLLLKLLRKTGYDVSEYESDLCKLQIDPESLVPDIKFYAKVALLDCYGKYKFKCIIPMGFTHIFSLGVEPNELCFKIIEARNVGNYNLTYKQSSYGIEIDRENMHSFDDFESEVSEKLSNYENRIKELNH